MRHKISSLGDTTSVFYYSDILLGVFHDGVWRHRIDPGAELARTGVLRDQRRAVSYTHLTLPTILLV